MRTKPVFALTFVIYFFVLLLNDGFMALDEYWVGVTRYIPAQNSSLMALVSPDDVKSPLQLLPMHVVAQSALKLGVMSPYWQYRSVIIVLGLLSVLLLALAFFKFAKINKLTEQETGLLFLMFSFYFAGPFAFTRPMFESIAAPWLALAAVYALKYDQDEKLKDLLWGVSFASIAFVLRQQLGLCALIFILLPILKKQIKHVIKAGILGLVFLIISGIPDYYIRGKFHYSLLSLTIYNVEHGQEYGDRTIFFYPILIFIICFIPFFIKKYPRDFLKDYIKKSRSLIIMLLLFVFLHSLFPNKWERFIISVIPLLLFLTFPFLNYLQQNFRQYRMRLIALYSLNGVLFFVASFFPSQKNLIEMSRYLDQHLEIKNVYRVAETPGWITDAFILNKQYQFIDADQMNLNEINWQDCGNVFVVGEAQADQYAEILNALHLKAQFNVNLIEQLSFKMNPKNNLRRVQLSLYSGCDK